MEKNIYIYQFCIKEEHCQQFTRKDCVGEYTLNFQVVFPNHLTYISMTKINYTLRSLHH